MGLIRAAVGATGGVLADQWKEFFYCESLDKETMVVKGEKRVGNRSSNTKGNDNIISNGSGICVADGQCAIIVEQGKVVEICAEPGEFTYDTSTEPSIFAGNLGESVKESFKTLGRRFTYGGDTAKDQRVYYFNTKELLDNKFGTPNPIPFRVVDSKANIDIDVSVRCAGTYSYRISDPILFYTNVCGNVSSCYKRSEIEDQLKAEFISALQPAFAQLSAMEIRPNQIVAHNTDLEKLMNDQLSAKWSELRGLTVRSVALATVTLPDDDAERIKQLQQASSLADPSKRDGYMATMAGSAMNAAASNPNGSMAGFMGMGMAMGMGGSMMSTPAQQQAYNQQQQAYQAQAVAQPTQAQAAVASGWTCSCGTVNQGNFCQNCGSKKPTDAPLYKCDKCGWTPSDPTNPPKFCPECGDAFDQNDVQ